MNEYNLSIYDIKPDIEVTIDKFEEIAISRLRVLKWIEHQKLQKRKCLIRQKPNLYNTKYLEDILKENNLYKNHQYDNLSHFICRLAFTEIEEYSSWFIKQELTLFEYKYKLEINYGYNKYILKQIESSLFDNILYPLYTPNDIILNDLNGRSPIPYFQFNSEYTKLHKMTVKYFPFHIVPFYICSNKLIAQRMVYIRNGYAFIPNFLWPEIVTTKYMTFLVNKMKETKESLLRMKNNNKIMYELSKIIHIIKGLNKVSLSIDTHNKISLSPRNFNEDYMLKIVDFTIDKYLNLFPICMRYSYESLMNDGHLMNNGRIQLTLFLKGIGLTMEECLIFLKKDL